jgi:hypothetical protein
MQQTTSPTIGLCGSFAQRDAVIRSIPLLFLHVLEKGVGVGVRHHERCFTAVPELNITNPSIPIYVERNLFQKDTSKLYVVALKRRWILVTKVSLISATVNKQKIDQFVSSYNNLRSISYFYICL